MIKIKCNRCVCFVEDTSYKYCISCREKTRVNAAKWRAANPDKAKDAHRRSNMKSIVYQKEWYQKNKDRCRDNCRKWSQENPDKRSNYYKKWQLQNKDNCLYRDSKRRASKKQAQPLWANEIEIRKIFKEAVRITKQTNIEHQVDHIVPLQSNLVCGLHWEGNMQIITRSENAKKSNTTWPDMWED